MLAVLARRMVEKLDVCMGAYVVLQSDFVWMYFVKRDGYLRCLWLMSELHENMFANMMCLAFVEN
jgi:hypothetical protein